MAGETWYLKIQPLQEPFGLRLDDTGRQLQIFNVVVTKRPSSKFLEELAWILQTAGVGTWGTDIFAGETAVVPDGPGPYLVITETGGPGAVLRQNEPTISSYPRPTAQIAVRAKSYTDARAMSQAAYDALVAVINRFVSPVA